MVMKKAEPLRLSGLHRLQSCFGALVSKLVNKSTSILALLSFLLKDQLL